MRHCLLLIAIASAINGYAQHTDILDTTAIQKITGIKGVSNHGEYKITVPQNDLNVMVDSFRIIPAMGLGTWVGFTPTAKGVMVMGDIVLTENDL